MLSRIVEWYNYVKLGTVKCEFNLVAKEVRRIDKKLRKSIRTYTWDDYKQSYIDLLYAAILDLHTRIVKTQENIRKMEASIDSWGMVPMYPRKDFTTDGLIVLTDCEVLLEKRIVDIEMTRVLIDRLMEMNFRLFFNIFKHKKPVDLQESGDEEMAEEELEEEMEEEILVQEKSVQTIGGEEGEEVSFRIYN